MPESSFCSANADVRDMIFELLTMVRVVPMVMVV